MKDPARGSLDEALAKLPRDIVPPRYLWPSIVRDIARRPRRTPQMMFAAAAAVAALCLAAAMVWAVLHGRVAPAPPAPAVVLSLDEPHDAGYVAARTALLETFEQRLALLDPDTRARIEANLAVIRKARDDIRKELAADPDSPLLAQLLESAWHDEFDLYDDVIRTTQTTLARI